MRLVSWSLALLAVLGLCPVVASISLEINRRDVLSVAVGITVAGCQPAWAAADGLATKLAQRDPNVLKNSVFNVPPPVQVYPPFMRGSWKVTSRFNGYLFPSKNIPKNRLTSDITVPGFQKCSIAAICDVGKEEVVYTMKIQESNGWDNRVVTFAQQIDAYLGYKAVAEVIYNARSNPNRVSIDFVDYKTRNAERIELFCNARESELVEGEDGRPVFVCSEYIRQVTFGTGPDVGVARQVPGNYAHFWTWKKQGDNQLTGNLLTAAYLDPQDPLFFDEPSRPVAIYSHVLSADRLDLA